MHARECVIIFAHIYGARGARINRGVMNKKLILILLATVLIFSSALFLVSCGEEANIKEISIYSMPKTEYTLGESLDLTDARLLIKYDGGKESIVDVTPDMLSGFDSTLLGKQYIKIYYANHTASFSVNVSRAEESGHELVTLDAKLNYVEGQLLDTTNIYMIVNFVDGTYERIDVTPDMCFGFNSNRIGSQTITVECVLDGTVYSSTFAVGVTERELVGIEVTSYPTKNIYYVGDRSLDLTGGKLFLRYNSGYSDTIDMSDVNGNAIAGLTCSWDYATVNDKTIVTVEYKEHTATFPIKVKVRDVVSFETVVPIQTQMQNLDLDLTGAVIKIYYNNNESEEVALPSEKVTFVGFDKTQVGEQEIAVKFSYGGVELATGGNLEVTVAPREATTLEIVNAPRIYQDTEFKVSDFTARVVFNNGERGDEFNLNNSMISWENNVPLTSYATAGEKNWYITYNTVEYDYTFNVIALRVQEIELYNAVNVYAFFEGDVDTSEVRMTVTYNSGRVEENVLLASSMVSFDNTVLGLQKATINYTDKYESGYVTDLYVTVVREIYSVEVSGFRTEYVKGEMFSPMGMEIKVSYVGAGEIVLVKETDEDFYSLWSFRTEDSESLVLNETGVQNVYLMNAGLKNDVALEITVKNEFKSFGPIYRQTGSGLVELDTLGEVVQGTSLDLTDLVVLVTREGDVEYLPLTEDMINYNLKDTTVGERKVIVYYPNKASYTGEAGRTVEINVNVIEKSVQGIKILKNPDRTLYFKDTPNATVEYDGMEISLVFDNGTFESIDVTATINSGALRIQSIDFVENGEKEVEVTYLYVNTAGGEERFDATFNILVVDPTPVKVEWKDGVVPDVRNTIGADFDLNTAYYWEKNTGRPLPLREKSINIYFSNSDIATSTTIAEILEECAELGISYLSVKDYNSNQVGDEPQNAHIVFGDNVDVSLTVSIKVSSRTLYRIELLYFGEPLESGETLSVIQGAQIDLAPLALRLVFSDGSVSEIPMEASYVNVSDANVGGYNVNDPNLGERTVTISYTYANETAPVTQNVVFDVKETSLTKIEINDIPKIYYIEGEAFDVSDGSVMLYYDNGTTSIEFLSTFSQNSPTSSKNIDTTNFNNKEFSGFSKVQRIYVKFSGCTTSYNIYMRDRRQAEIEFKEDNVYTFTYGEVQAPVVGLNGYYAYGDTERTISFVQDRDGIVEANEFKVEYIPQEIWLNQTMDATVDYTVCPTTVGRYVIVVSYAGDGIHNEYQNAEKLLTINKKTVYIGFRSTEKIYGTDNPGFLLTMSNTAETVSQDPLSLFAYDDGFMSANFNPEAVSYDSTIAKLVDADGNVVKVDGLDCLVNAFNIVYRQKGVNVDVGLSAPAGYYTIAIDNQFVSPNYNIVYKEGGFTVNPRRVKVTPESMEYVYGGTVIPTINFSTSAIDGDDYATGIYGNDTLQGSLSRDNVSANSVGSYDVNIGSLQTYNPNYKIEFVKGVATVTILPRTIYVKVDSIIRTYGEVISNEPTFNFYSDAACTVTDNAFAKGDNLATIGNIVYNYENTVNGAKVDQYTNAGEYPVFCTIDMSGSGAGNYTVKSVKGIVEVTRRPVAVKALATEKVYGSLDPVLNYEVTSIANIVESGLILNANGQLETLEGKLERASGENYGNYTINVGTLGANSNYEIRFTSSQFSILRKDIFVAIEPVALSKVYDGKVPSIDVAFDAETGKNTMFKLYESRDEGAAEYNAQDNVYNLISFSFVGGSKNAGDYRINVQVNSNNYSVQMYAENGYFYTITKRKIAITRDEFTGLPDGLEYKGSAYTFSANININDLQQVYNLDGTPATDDNNNPIYDTSNVTLSISEATDAKTYVVDILEVEDKNYEIDFERTQSIEFTIVPRIIQVVILTNAENNTIEREFNNQTAYVAGNECSLENLINETDRIQYELGFFTGENEVSPMDVRFDLNGDVIGYDIRIKDGTLNKNFIVQLKEDYKFKIVPKEVVLRVNANNLKKSYDGNEPSLTTAMFQTATGVTGFDSNSVTFSFVRETQDGRDNTSVGTYSVSVACSNRNFSVRTQESYVYQIEAANVSVSISSSALEKAYDGKEFSFTYNDLSFGLSQGTAPIIHNFRYGTEYEEFDAKIQELKLAIQDLDNQLGLVDFAETTYALSNLSTSEVKANTLYNILVNESRNPMQTENTTAILNALSQSINSDANRSVIYNIQKAKTYLQENKKLEAQSAYLVCLESLKAIKDTFSKEESYCAFILGDASDNTTVEVGVHKFDVIFKDYNRNFKLLNTNKTITILKHTLLVNVNAIEITYGFDIYDADNNFTIPYELFDPRSNEVIDTSELQIAGAPIVTGVKNVGRYSIDVSSISILEDDGSGNLVASPNYELVVGTVEELTVNKAKLSVKILDVKDENLFVYGKTVESSQLNGEYELFVIDEGGHIDNSAENPYRIEALAWAAENGYGDLHETKIFELYFGRLYYGESLTDVLKTTGVRYNCYISGNNGTQIFDTTSFDAGDYPLSATGFRADNYDVKVIPGVLTVAKRQLSIYTQYTDEYEGEYIGYYEKEYGNSSINYIYSGFHSSDTPSSVPVFVDLGEGEQGEQVATLKDMQWSYSPDTYEGEVEIDPLLPTTPVRDSLLAITPSSYGYVMKNYEINFVTIGIRITKAQLSCTVKPVNGAMITSIYMDLPTEADYEFSYTGFKNEDDESIITTKPTVSFKDGPNFYNKGTHQLDSRAFDTSSIDLQNYELVVEPFQYLVEARSVYVKLEGVDPVMSDTYNKFVLSPYLAEIEGTTSESSSTVVVNKANIYGGQYGKNHFRFTIEGVTSEIQTAFDSYTVQYFTNSDGGVKFDVENDGTKYKEIYRYNELYKHGISALSINYETGKGIARLNGMIINTENFKFVYEEFEVQVYNAIAAVAAGINNDEKLVAGDLSLTEEEINQKINFHIFNYAIDTSPTAMTVAEMLSQGILKVSGSLPSVTSKTVLMTYTLSNPQYDYVLSTAFDASDDFYNYYYSMDTTSNVAVTDSRPRVYDYSSVATCTLPIRFYPEATTSVTNPALSGGVSYGQEVSFNNTTTVTVQETLYNAMRLEFSLKSNSTTATNGLELAFNGLNGNAVITLVFNFGVGNAVGVRVNDNGNVQEGTYSLEIGNLFDGRLHEIKAYLDKENRTIILAVDGASGEILDLRGLISNPEYLVESSSLALTFKGSAVVKSLTLSEQGLYDGVGAHIRIPVKSDNTIRVNASTYDYAVSVSSLGAFFGLTNMDASYTAEYYVNGVKCEGESVRLVRGAHLVELALYKDGVLVDYDAVTVVVNRKRTPFYTPLSSSSAKSAAAGSVIPFYTVKSDYVAEAGQDATLVASSTAEQSYILLNSLETAFGYTSNYLRFAFCLDPVALYDAENKVANFAQGTYKFEMDLVSNASMTLQDAFANRVTNYVGASLEFTRNQTSDVQFGSTNDGYTYDVKLLTYTGGDVIESVDIATGITSNAFEVTLYRDRTDYMFGKGGALILIKNLLNGTTTELNWLDKSELNIFAILRGSGERLTVLDCDFEGGANANVEYLLNDTVVTASESVTMNAGDTIKSSLSLSTFDTLTFAYTIPSGYVPAEGDSIKFTVADYNGQTMNGMYITYLPNTNELTFYFSYKVNGNGINFVTQRQTLTVPLTEGRHTLTVKFNKELNSTVASNFVGGDNATNLVGITETLGNVVHYSEILVSVDDEQVTFYAPLYNSVGLWIMENGTRFGETNDYSYIEGVPSDYVPTFISLHNTVEITSTMSVEVNGFMLTEGDCNAFANKGVTENPII